MEDITYTNGERSWIEVHHEVVLWISQIDEKRNLKHRVAREVAEANGSDGLYDLAIRLTNEFELEYEGKTWDGSNDIFFAETIARFILPRLSGPTFWEYSVSTNTIWTSFDFGTVEAFTQEEALKLAKRELNSKFNVINEVLRNTEYTKGLSISFAEDQIQIRKKGETSW